MKKNFSGTLFLVVGNSGSGKDSIISGAIKKFEGNAHLVKRYITREPSEFEDNYCISTERFMQMEKEGMFALKWHIYGLNYGVPIEIDEWLSAGDQVVLNVSRTIIKEAREKYENIKVVFIEVPFEITLQRVKNRGRESGEKLQERIERAKTHQKLPEADFIVDNSGDLSDAIDQFLDYMVKVVS
ncbi:MAG: phosphonate metabolism protein/1,5-bisphosphokinase (PRPP-forming) PhnN [Promethearchaeota archaeon]|nr:MAG: phosphonate metabolism protein/1,5-bisphosphokinase (PRPP-forming) PhnN [Candidatus Lokiarchaeota archaeon]